MPNFVSMLWNYNVEVDVSANHIRYLSKFKFESIYSLESDVGFPIPRVFHF